MEAISTSDGSKRQSKLPLLPIRYSILSCVPLSEDDFLLLASVYCEVLMRWGWGKRWSLSLVEEHEASPVRRNTSTRTLRASCAFLLHRSVSARMHILYILYIGHLCCQSSTWSSSLLPFVRCRKGRASSNTGWTIYEPNMGRCYIIYTSWKASQSVSCILHSVMVVYIVIFGRKQHVARLWKSVGLCLKSQERNCDRNCSLFCHYFLV